MEIEKKSWKITEKLVEAFDGIDLDSGGYEKIGAGDERDSNSGFAEHFDSPLSSDSEIEDNSDDGDAVLRRGIEFLLNGDRLGFAGWQSPKNCFRTRLPKK